MYLGLLLTPMSEAKLRILAPDAPDDLHLTIIHSPQKIGTLEPLLMEDLRAQGILPHGLLVTSAFAHDVFGPPAKRVNVIKLALTQDLLKLRELAEKILADRGISWSKDYEFSPHITVGNHLPPLPLSLMFNKRVWK